MCVTTKRRNMRGLDEKPVGIEAAELVTGERQASYGDPLDNYDRQAQFITAVLGPKLKEPVSRREAVHIMISLKQCRDLSTPLRDNEVDICGYATILQMDREDLELDDGEEPDCYEPKGAF
jgi:hypothetical protein